MSLNAFYSAYGNTQNALGDPRGDARKREEEDMRNAMLQTQFSQQQDAYKAQQAEKARLEAAQRARFQFRTQRGYGQPQAQPMPQAPQMAPQPQMQAMPSMQGGAPIEPQAPQIDPSTGRQIDVVTVQGQMKVPMPSQEDELTFLLRDAYTRGDVNTFNELFDMKRQSMSAEELAGRQQIAAVAGQILQLPVEQRASAVMQALERLGVDPQDVAIDDYVNDPAALEQALRFEMTLGAPEEAMKENIRVQGTFDQFRPFERQDLGNRVGVFDPRTGRFSEGPRIGLSPNTAATTSTQLRTAQIGAGSRIKAADLNRQGMAAMAAAGGKIELVPADDLPDGE